MNVRPISKLIAISALSCATFSCTAQLAEAPAAFDQEKLEQGARVLGFDPAGMQIEGDRVIVEDDIMLYGQQLEAVADEAATREAEGGAGGGRVDKAYILRHPFANVEYRINQKFLAHINLHFDSAVSAEWRSALEFAARQWSQASFHNLRTRIKFHVAPDLSTHAHAIDVEVENKAITKDGRPNTSVIARAAFPRMCNYVEWACSTNTIGDTTPGDLVQINTNFPSNVGPEGRRNAAVHELGHILGFPHPGNGTHIPYTHTVDQPHASCMWTGDSSDAGYCGGELAGLSYEFDELAGLDECVKTGFVSHDDAVGAYVVYPANVSQTDLDGEVAACKLFDPAADDTGFCVDANCPCGFGHGDCDYENTSRQCATGLECIRDQGVKYGMPSNYDVCLQPSWCEQFDSNDLSQNFCIDSRCPCGVGEGDCDNDAQCGGALLCGRGNGHAIGIAAGEDYDICVHAPYPGCPPYPWHDLSNMTEFCSAACPCSLGQGDCDNRNECQANLRCARDAGADFGFPSYYDVCVSPDAGYTRFDD